MQLDDYLSTVLVRDPAAAEVQVHEQSNVVDRGMLLEGFALQPDAGMLQQAEELQYPSIQLNMTEQEWWQWSLGDNQQLRISVPGKHLSYLAYVQSIQMQLSSGRIEVVFSVGPKA